MQPHRYGYPPDASWPSEPPGFQPAPPPAGPAASVVPVAVGATAAGIAAIAFLTAAVMAVLVFNSGDGDRIDSDSIVTILTVAAGFVLALLILYAISLIIIGHDAGRSGIVWIGAAALPWTVLIPGGIVSMQERNVDAVPIVSYACGMLAAVGLLVAMMLLGTPPGRRWLAERVLANTGALWPPAPLVAARKRFRLSTFLVLAGCSAQLVLTPLVTTDGRGRSTFLAIFAVVLVLAVAVPQVLGLWGAALAFGGRRGGAHLARAAGAVLIFGVQPFVLLGVLNGLAGIWNDDAAVPPAATGPLGGVVTAVVLLGIVQYVAGLAALADPRSEVYLRSGGRRAG